MSLGISREERRYSDDGPVCPHCDRQYTPDEGSYYDEARFTEMDCDECGNTFDVRVCNSTSWSTSQRKPIP